MTANRTIDINPADDSLTVAADNVKVNTNNTLTSTSTTQPLSANQGKVLNEKVAQVETDLNTEINAITHVLQNDSIDDTLYITDSEGNIIAKFDSNGLTTTKLTTFNGGTGGTSLFGKELYTIGDSLSVGGLYQFDICAICGCSFDNNKNTLSGYQLSTGGSSTSGAWSDGALGRILNMKNKGYNPDIILLQNVNDLNNFNVDGSLVFGSENDKAIVINQWIKGCSFNDFIQAGAWVQSSLLNIPSSTGVPFSICACIKSLINIIII